MTNPKLPEQVHSRHDFVAFVHQLRADLVANPERWENVSLASYLEAVAAWVEDSAGSMYDEAQLPAASWRWFSHVLLAASTYE